MEILTDKQMQEVDRRAMEELKMPGLILMENAGNRVFQEIAAVNSLPGKKILIACGGGNNGGDGFVIARHLAAAGAKVAVLALAAREKYRGDAAVNLNLLNHTPLNLDFILKETDLARVDFYLEGASLVVDSLLGTGLSQEVHGLYKEVIDKINLFSGRVIATDIPSGINASTGAVMGVAVKASLTVTFAFPKRGLFFYPGREYCGKIKIADIFIPSFLAEEEGSGVVSLTKEKALAMLPQRRGNSHKGDYGRVFILAGAPGYTGAAFLTSMTAQRAGAGLVTLGVPAGLHNIMESLLTEVMTVSLPETPNGGLSAQSPEVMKNYLKKSDVLAIGPGLGKGKDIREILLSLLPIYASPMVIDADGLNAIAPTPEVLRQASLPPVLTPHLGEMSRLTGLSVAEIKKNSLELAREMSEKWQAVLVLKGAPTIVALPRGAVYVNTTGNEGMATGGTGDVLTGLIAGFIAQGVSPAEAAVAAVYLHGFAGDLAAEKLGKRGLIASDVMNMIPEAFLKMEKG